MSKPKTPRKPKAMTDEELDLIEDRYDRYAAGGSSDDGELPSSVGRLLTEIRRLKAECHYGLQCPEHSGERHGQEAEELRAGIEKLMREADDPHGGDPAVLEEDLQALLDRVDARDSLAWQENRRKRSTRVAR